MSIKKKKLAAQSLKQAKQKETIPLVTGDASPPPRPKLPALNLPASDIETLKKIRQIDSMKTSE